jgi:hypothetical protein
MTPEEAALGSALSKLALNVCLMATAYGVRCLGPANPSHYERLKRYAQLARKRGREQQEQADLEVRLMPLRYAFAQEVTLYRREAGEVRPEGNGSGGWTVSPHWRRGHCTPRTSWLERANGQRPPVRGVEVQGERGGHISGARHLEWKELLAEGGRFKSPERLRDLFRRRGIQPERTAVTC